MSLASGAKLRTVYICAPTGASELDSSLRAELRKHSLVVCPDARGVKPGANWRAVLRRQLDEADVCIVLAVPGKDRWETHILEALQKRMRRESPGILPVSLGPGAILSLPPFLIDLMPVRLPIPWAEADVAEVVKAAGSMIDSRNRVDARGVHGYVSEAHVRQFLGFTDEQTLRMRPADSPVARWTVVLGDNGTGKTTLLRAIAAGSAGAPQAWREAADQCEICVVQDLGTDSREFVIDNKGEFDDLRPVCFGFGAGRRAAAAQLKQTALGPAATLFDDALDLPDAEEWFLRTDHAMRVDGTTAAKRHFGQVKAALLKLLPDVDDIKVTSQVNRTSVSVQMHGKWLPMAALSLGYKTALTWIVELARQMFERYPSSPSPLAEPALVLIDEIDLHLHPKWQRSLLEKLSSIFEKSQFIVTAHSPLIVQAAPNANLVLLRREGERLVIHNDVDDVRRWRVDQILASELFEGVPVHAPEVQELLRERAELLGRGQTAESAARLKAIDSELENVPTAVMPEDQEAMRLIREAARLLQTN